jgi:hypothetical protein
VFTREKREHLVHLLELPRALRPALCLTGRRAGAVHGGIQDEHQRHDDEEFDQTEAVRFAGHVCRVF